ncbi:proline-specific peptidase [Hyaloraphidium curvatum]|nr:proline-specific peptidase [Hyaloraphidium curvatum]
MASGSVIRPSPDASFTTVKAGPSGLNTYISPKIDILHGHLATPQGHRIYVQVVNPSGRKAPVLILHGGPGMASYYCEPMARLCEDNRPVVLYDQLGCGRSDLGPADRSLYTIDYYVEEVDVVRRGLGIGSSPIHLLGQSWGTLVAVAYLTKPEKPPGIVSVVLCAPCISTREWGGGIRAELFPKLPADVRETILDCEARGDYSSEAWMAAVGVFYERHVCRLRPWPKCVTESTAAGDSSPVYGYMWGPSEFTYTGTLKDVDLATPEVLGSLGDVPTLWTCGEEDECRPSSMARLKEMKGGARDRMHVFPGASHFHHIEREDSFVEVVGGFIAEVEGSE